MDEFIFSEESQERLDKYLSEKYDNLTRSRIQSLIEDESITVNGKASKASYKLKSGDYVSVVFPAAKELLVLPEDIPISVLYEDGDVLVVNKPKGMVVHPAPGHENGTLVNAVLFHCKNELSGINGVIRPGIVHRIDKDTTGSLIICKNDASHQAIAEQIASHTLNRKYHAIVEGVMKNDEGTVDAPIGRSAKDRKKMAVVSNGRRAVTHYKVLKRFNNHTYAEFTLETGRTHQIRVHMSHIGYPILGDTLYGRKSSKYNLEGQTLHAYLIGFIHPKTGEYVEVTAPIPKYFLHLLDIL